MATFEVPRRVDSGVRESLASLAATQVGVVRRDQLARCGLTRYQTEATVSAGRWTVWGAAVIVAHNGPLTRTQELWVAVLNAGEQAALAGRSAAAEQGLVGWEADRIEIVVPRGTCVPAGVDLEVKVHESRRFSAADLHPGRELRQVTIERAIVDVGAWSRSPRSACGVLAAGVQQRLTTAPRLYAELEKAGKVAHRRVMAAALADIDGGAQA